MARIVMLKILVNSDDSTETADIINGMMESHWDGADIIDYGFNPGIVGEVDMWTQQTAQENAEQHNIPCAEKYNISDDYEEGDFLDQTKPEAK